MKTKDKAQLENILHQFSHPNTPRGRALHTIDWFLNGKPVLKNHDNPRLSLFNGEPCF